MLEFHFGTMLAQVVIFLVLMFLVSRYALRPMLATMSKRTEHIQQQITSAEENRKEAEKLVKAQQEALEEARQEAKGMIERAKVQKEKEAEKIIREAEERSAKMIQEAKEEIHLEKEKALASLKDQVGSLSVQLTTKLVKQELDSKAQAKLMDQYLEQVGRLQ